MLKSSLKLWQLLINFNTQRLTRFTALEKGPEHRLLMLSVLRRCGCWNTSLISVQVRDRSACGTPCEMSSEWEGASVIILFSYTHTTIEHGDRRGGKYLPHIPKVVTTKFSTSW